MSGGENLQGLRLDIFGLSKTARRAEKMGSGAVSQAAIFLVLATASCGGGGILYASFPEVFF